MERQLIKHARKGDKDALLQLILYRQDEYYRLAWSYMKNKEDALDAMEDMIVQLYENIHRLKKIDSFVSWSNKILISCCHAIYRKGKRTVYVEQEYLEVLPDNKLNFEQKDAQLDVEQLLTKINSHQAEAIRLRYLHDMDLETIAKIEGVSIGTVKSRIFYGLKKLNRIYRGERDE